MGNFEKNVGFFSVPLIGALFTRALVKEDRNEDWLVKAAMIQVGFCAASYLISKKLPEEDEFSGLFRGGMYGSGIASVITGLIAVAKKQQGDPSGLPPSQQSSVQPLVSALSGIPVK